MSTRAESAAATRLALTRAAGDLLDEGGPDAVTLRAVGARAGVSRGAPYGHFTDKDHLLRQLAIDAWNSLSERLETIREEATGPDAKLEHALLALITVGREQPHLYEIMFTAPAGDAEGLKAVERSQQVFLDIVAGVVEPQEARRYGALLLASAHGIAGMELSGHLAKEKWSTTGDELVAMLVASVRRAR